MYDDQKTDETKVNQDDVTFVIPCIHFHAISQPNGDLITEFHNVSMGYAEGTVTAELYPADLKQWLPVSPLDNYAYAGKVRWDFAPGQKFTGNLALPKFAGDKTVGELIDMLNGSWLRITIMEEKHAINGKKVTIYHPARHFHWSSAGLTWIPEPCFTG